MMLSDNLRTFPFGKMSKIRFEVPNLKLVHDLTHDLLISLFSGTYILKIIPQNKSRILRLCLFALLSEASPIQAAAICLPDSDNQTRSRLQPLQHPQMHQGKQFWTLTSPASLLLDRWPRSIPELYDDLEDAQEKVLAGRLVGQLGHGGQLQLPSRFDLAGGWHHHSAATCKSVHRQPATVQPIGNTVFSWTAVLLHFNINVRSVTLLYCHS